MGVMVYDRSINKFRQAYNNYNDDNRNCVCGTVYFSRNALVELSRHFPVCGFVFIDKITNCDYPIDIQKDRIATYEWVFNGLPYNVQALLEQYNITDLPAQEWSSFFLNWQMSSCSNALEESGNFIKLCNNILTNDNRYQAFINSGVSICEPTTYDELCSFTKKLFEISEFDYLSGDYTEEIKYLFDSLINRYHINFNDQEILSYCMLISKIVDERWKG